MHFPFFSPGMTAFNTLFSSVREGMKEVDHMLFCYRSFFGLRLLVAYCSHCRSPSGCYTRSVLQV